MLACPRPPTKPVKTKEVEEVPRGNPESLPQTQRRDFIRAPDLQKVRHSPKDAIVGRTLLSFRPRGLLLRDYRPTHVLGLNRRCHRSLQLEILGWSAQGRRRQSLLTTAPSVPHSESDSPRGTSRDHAAGPGNTRLFMHIWFRCHSGLSGHKEFHRQIESFVVSPESLRKSNGLLPGGRAFIRVSLFYLRGTSFNWFGQQGQPRKRLQAMSGRNDVLFTLEVWFSP